MSAKYQASEVAKHNHPDDLWLVLHGKIYDVTKFLKEHPGGEEVLIGLAGTDATLCFDDIGHSQEAKQLKDSYEIGALDGVMAPSTTTTTTTTTGSSDATGDDDDHWEYVETKAQSSPYIPVFIALGVLVYAVLFYYVFY
ncbi:cytochrome b5-like [Phymastichus coffea]|uniref:cytochrome b5-like n=1 Tax=Phymastichus coffea TaxID=108790 RepID=UPI00273A783A|nr:cytochrome b5-like [Phymastichus coffea]